ncbi:hypothetical protein J4E93_000029 [Alternaria ventricosa]|uniref:uncharacterized protein n=1 Tax=Alternaria ventricosa TaxID=1187951 RepID=UPI0020C3B031|nr:uncharacterized protein J4E93_000029 [Alternaria ventricosa]KAI4655319.1 hypothetical protein J4E93_000029 [Alternaria ventricosa]
MQGFVARQRTGSPAAGQPQGKPDRQANAANARVSIRNGHPVQQPRATSGIPARGLNITQNSSAVLQQPPQNRQSGPGPSQKRDLYDTDAESLDTTVNPSIVQVEDSQQKEQHYPQQDHVVNLGGTSEMEGEDDEYADEPEHREDGSEGYDDEELLQENQDFLHESGVAHLPYDEQLDFLHQAGRGGLPTVRGDSYPPTTNGEPSEWEGGQEALSDFHNEFAPISPPPQRQNMNKQAAHMPASHAPQQQQRRNMPIASQGTQQPSALFRHSAQLREHSRTAAPSLQAGGQNVQYHALALPTSQHQAHNPDKHSSTANLPMYPGPHPSTQVQPSKSQQRLVRQSSGPRTQPPPRNNAMPSEPHAPQKRQPQVPAIQEPVAQQQSVEQAPIEEPEVVSHEDYDHTTLFGMSYEQLRNESFDTNPRVRPSVLSKEDLQKPLVERLELVQQNPDAVQQSEFFQSLPTTEWEDAGDWFLDRFQDIIRRTKEARQKKRKLAQEFEAEVEKRHEHVSKRQHQVQQAMEKMKSQGEGLVPRSPRSRKG